MNSELHQAWKTLGLPPVNPHTGTCGILSRPLPFALRKQLRDPKMRTVYVVRNHGRVYRFVHPESLRMVAYVTYDLDQRERPAPEPTPRAKPVQTAQDDAYTAQDAPERPAWSAAHTDAVNSVRAQLDRFGVLVVVRNGREYRFADAGKIAILLRVSVKVVRDAQGR